MAQQVDAHNEALTLMDWLRQGRRHAGGEELLAAKMKVAVQQHLDMAGQLFNKHNS